MKKAIVLEQNDIKELIAKQFDVPTANVIKSQYSYTVIIEEKENLEKGE